MRKLDLDSMTPGKRARLVALAFAVGFVIEGAITGQLHGIWDVAIAIVGGCAGAAMVEASRRRDTA